ncbi:MAG TPA: hypothetical protein EYG03_15475 [Planctomycetes bacterium]|nr:hypothetical protein [Planctomycetota bacterium]
MAYVLLFLIFGLTIIVLSIPVDCWRAVRQNCRRQNGSFSRGRATRELKQFSDHVLTLTALGVPMVLACFALGTLVASYWLPTELIIEAVISFQLNPIEWKSDLADVRAAHTQFLVVDQGWSNEQAIAFQKGLWHARLSVILITCGSLVIGLMVLMKLYATGTATFVWGIRMRRKVYASRDVERMKWAAGANPVGKPKAATEL